MKHIENASESHQKPRVTYGAEQVGFGVAHGHVSDGVSDLSNAHEFCTGLRVRVAVACSQKQLERGRGAHLLQELQVAVRVTSFSFSGGAEHRCDVGVALEGARVIGRSQQQKACPAWTSACAAKYV